MDVDGEDTTTTAAAFAPMIGFKVRHQIDGEHVLLDAVEGLSVEEEEEECVEYPLMVLRFRS